MRKFSFQSPLGLQQIVLSAATLLALRWKEFLIAAASFSLMTAVVATFFDARINAEEMRIASDLRMSKEEVQEEIATRLDSITESETLSYVQTLRKDGMFLRQPVTEQNLVIQYVIRTSPYVIGLIVIDLGILFVCFTYFLSFFGTPIDTAYESARKLPLLLLRSIGLWFFLCLRSWVWIPFLGPLLAFYVGPRLSLAPVILASGEASVLQSVRLSLERTRGRWFATTLRLLTIGLIGIACLWFSIVVAGSIGLFVLKIGFLLWLLGLMATIGFSAALLVVTAAGMR